MASLIVVDNVNDVPLALRWIERLRSVRPDALAMAVVRPVTHDLAWPLRSAGTVMVWDEFWQVPAMARLVERFWQRIPPPDLSVEERIWNNLPWNSTSPAPQR